jgi:hypothetical protein
MQNWKVNNSFFENRVAVLAGGCLAVPKAVYKDRLLSMWRTNGSAVSAG